jgi:dipeptidyl aminopeptidase/acylaminoacyl peptidase
MSLREVCPKEFRKMAAFILVASFICIATYGKRLGLADNIEAFSIQSLPFPRGGDGAVQSETQAKRDPKRLVTVADAIQMTRIAGRNAINAYSGGLSADFASFSPDGKWLVFLVKKGNLEKNTNEYSMLLYEVGDLLGSPHPRTLVSFTSSSNRAAIDEVTWMGDSDTILFLGQQWDETTQLYSVERVSGKIRRLTEHPTNLLSYSTSDRADRFAYFAEKPLKDLIEEDVLRHGFHVSDERLADLIAGRLRDSRADLLVTDEAGSSTQRLQVSDMQEGSPLFVSPDGHYLVLKTLVPNVPAIWHEYKDELLQNLMRQRLPNGIPAYIERYTLLDLKSGLNRALLDSPVSDYGSDVKWLSDSQSIILTGMYLPLTVADPVERTARERKAYVIEVKVPSLEFSKIAERDLKLMYWNPRTQILRLKERRPNQIGSTRAEEYEKKSDRWERVEIPDESAGSPVPDITVEQDLNEWPRVIATNPKTDQKATLLDLNPQFNDLKFGHVETIKWKGGDSREVQGGLYLPPDYVTGKKYPLVIQTHGFDPRAFWIDGPFSTAFAAQPLVANGIVVLQIPDSHDWSTRDTPLEAPFMMKTYENAIDYLDRKGVIDRHRLGLIGFSQTCLYVQYMLTHSKYQIAAAVVADGIDGGYFQYTASGNSSPYMKAIREGLIGTSPFGSGLELWMKRSSGFLLDRVNTPLLIQAIHPPSLLEEWEWFAGLLRLKKPVDFVYIPSGYHILQKPWDRMVSQQGDVDWFCFWLKDEEDPDPAKGEQYGRWSRLRDLTHQDTGPGVHNQGNAEAHRR